MDFQNNFKEYLSKKQSENEEMTQKETQELQEALDKSKATAEEEEQKREYDRQAEEIQKRFYKPDTSADVAPEEAPKEKQFTPKQWSKGAKSPVRVIKSDKQFLLTFQDLIDVSGVALDIVHHIPTFSRPLDPSSSPSDRITALSDYYRNIDKAKAAIARLSLHRASLPKPILYLFKTRGASFEGAAEAPVQEVYVSRAGRQVKRKIYTEEQGDSDSDADLSIKKNRAHDSDAKITLDTPFVPEESFGEEKTTSKAVKPKKDTPKRPTSLNVRTYSSRCDEMFDKMIEGEERKRQQQQEMDDFQRTLPNLDEVEEENWLLEGTPRKDSKEDDENFVRRRVTPPIPTKGGKGRGKRSAKEGVDKKEPKASQKEDSPPGSPILKRYANLGKSPETRSKSKPRSQKTKECPLADQPSTSSKFQKTPCPICGREFLQSEIMNHAATCGIDEEEPTAGTSTSSVEKIRCELCEQEFVMNTDYEVHVKQCIASKVSDL